MATYLQVTEAKPGLRLLDNDPRNHGRIVEVVDVSGTGVWYTLGKRTHFISFSRIFTDGKSRHQGYNVVA